MANGGGSSHQRAVRNRLLGNIDKRISEAVRKADKGKTGSGSVRDRFIVGFGMFAEYLALRYGAQWLAWVGALLVWMALVDLCKRRQSGHPIRVIAISIALASALGFLTFLLVSTEANFENLPGMSIHAVIKINDSLTAHRRYIADFGSLTTGEIALYVSDDNIFTLMVTTRNKEPYAVQVPLEEIGKLNDFVYLVGDVGLARDHTIIRVSANGRELRRLALPYRVDVGVIGINDGKVGADLSGSNGATFELAELIIYSSTLTEIDRDRLNAYVKQRYNMDLHRPCWWCRIFGAFKSLPQAK